MRCYTVSDGKLSEGIAVNVDRIPYTVRSSPQVGSEDHLILGLGLRDIPPPDIYRGEVFRADWDMYGASDLKPMLRKERDAGPNTQTGLLVRIVVPRAGYDSRPFFLTINGDAHLLAGLYRDEHSRTKRFAKDGSFREMDAVYYFQPDSIARLTYWKLRSSERSPGSPCDFALFCTQDGKLGMVTWDHFAEECIATPTGTVVAV